MWAGGPAPVLHQQEAPSLSTAAARAGEEKVEAKKEESGESDDDMGFGVLWLNLLSNTLNKKAELLKKKKKQHADALAELKYTATRLDQTMVATSEE